MNYRDVNAPFHANDKLMPFRLAICFLIDIILCSTDESAPAS